MIDYERPTDAELRMRHRRQESDDAARLQAERETQLLARQQRQQRAAAALAARKAQQQRETDERERVNADRRHRAAQAARDAEIVGAWVLQMRRPNSSA